MRKLFSTLCLLLTAASLLAVPAKRTLCAVAQPDGTTVMVRLVGDEFFNYAQTADGLPVVRDSRGAYLYARFQQGRLVPTDVLAHDASMRNASELALTDELARMSVEQGSEAIERRLEASTRREARGQVLRTVSRAGAYNGQKKGIIILVNFADSEMTHPQSEFYAQMNEPNYSQNGHIGSLSDYFYDQSYGQLHIDFDVVGPVTVSHGYAYYGSNKSNGNDMYPGTMITEAVQLADASGVDFSRYDWDGDGNVDQVFVIYAGHSAAEGVNADPNAIWPHEWTLTAAKYYGSGGNGAIMVDGVRVDQYACSSELRGEDGAQMNGIGTAAHEFSHCLGLPDFYDTQGNSPGMGIWSLMDFGCYNGDGCVPAPYTAYERWYSGWMEPTELTEGCIVRDMKPITEVPEAYLVRNAGCATEYYLIESQQTRHSADCEFRCWGQGIYDAAHGALIYHVDYNATHWAGNTVNNTASHQRMTFVPANNKHVSTSTARTLAELTGALWPGASGNRNLTNTSMPAASVYNRNTDGAYFLNHPITDITENAGLITFTFDGGRYVPAPTTLPATDVTAHGFTAHWTTVAEATTYAFEVQEQVETAEMMLFEEDFAANPAFDEAKDGTTDISAHLDQYLATSGWSGNALYQGAKRLKFSSGSVAGMLQSKLFEAPVDGEVGVEACAQRYGLSTSQMVVSLRDKSNKVLAAESVPADGQRHALTFPEVTSDFRVRFESSTTKQIYLTYASASAQYLSTDEPLRAPVLPTVYDGLSETSLAVTGLKAGATYSYRVKAVMADGESEWSDRMEVTTDDESAIEGVTDDKATGGATYTLSGVRVKDATRPGLYIRGGKKVLVK